jgi:hypothetical protein
VSRFGDLRVWGAVVLAVNIAAVVSVAWVRWKARSLRTFAPGQSFTLPAGLTPDGKPVRFPSPTRSPCYLVRYGSDSCPYSKADVQVLESLERTLSERGCIILVMAPVPELFPQPVGSGGINLAFVDLSSAWQLQFAETPTTLTLDARSVIRWSKVGSLGREDEWAAVRSLR